MRDNVKLKGQLKFYMQWPAIMILLLVVMNIWIYLVSRKAGMILSIFVAVYAVMVCFFYFYYKSLIMSDLVDFAAQYGIVQNTLLKELTIPYAILMDDGKVVWLNDAFRELVGVDNKSERYLSKYIPELNRSIFPKEATERPEIEIQYHDREYTAELRYIPVEGFSEAEQLLELPKEKEYFIAVYLKDVTELNTYIKQNEDQKLVAGLIYIDNYDEVLDSVEEVRVSLLVALIDRKINQYVAAYDGIVKKMESDKYFIVIKRQGYNGMEADKFSVLEEVKEINIGNTMPATLSIGLGVNLDTYTQSYNDARVAIDLALARGGDQAVIKTPEGIKYYGGKREQTSKNTRVKARVKAEALREFISAKDQVLVMGHKLADVDSFGAAIGIYRAATALEKKAHIVINEVTSSVRPLYNAFIEDSAYPDDMFLTSEEVKNYTAASTLLVVVDTSKKEMTDCEMLLDTIKTVVVLDHHRQGSNIIHNAVLSYIEPYASSSCEMVAEVLQYIVDGIKITSMEANSLYAGIMIDTNNFMNRTGVRTFEAAAFLRRCGADITFVRKLFREDIDSYRVKSDIVSRAEIFMNEFAISTGANNEVESPTIVGAQAANELLNIEYIKASFVFTMYKDKIYVSARAIDEVNVQVIMERLGGGGHLNTAGAQFEGISVREAIRQLKETLQQMMEEGDL